VSSGSSDKQVVPEKWRWPKTSLLYAYFNDPRGELWRARIKTRHSYLATWLASRLGSLRPTSVLDWKTARPVEVALSVSLAEWPAEWVHVLTSDNGAVLAAVVVHPWDEASTFVGLKLPGAGLGESQDEYAVYANVVALRDGEAELEIEANEWVDGESFFQLLLDICETWPEVAEQWNEPPARGEAALAATDKPECLRWRKHVQSYLDSLPADVDPTLEGLADKLCLGYDTVRERSSEHRRCCFDWRTVKRLRKIPG